MSRFLLLLAALVSLSFTLLAGPPRPNPFRGEPVSAVAEATPEAEGDADFTKGEYRKAAEWYASLAAINPRILSAEQKNAWAFCRIKMAAESLNSSAEPSARASLEKEIAEALALAPNHAEVQKLGQAVLALSRQESTMAEAGLPGKPLSAAPSAWETLESASFTVKFQGRREVAEKVLAAAEAKRTAIFERWSGPTGGTWLPRCEIVLHASAEAYASATGKPAAATGHATVRLAEGKVAERHIDLRADDETMLQNSLPRELTHVVLADLFPFTPPPRWAEEGMAVLAGSSEEIDRYRRTCVKCAREGKLFSLAVLLEMKEFPPAEKITGFYCGSVSLVEYLVRIKGEKHFTTFLRDCQRYGSFSALKRQYGVESPKLLQDSWLKSAIR